MKAYKFLAAAVVLTAQASLVQAADMPRSPVYAPVTPKLIPAEVGSNWYIRGDAGYTMFNDPSTIISSGTAFFNESLDGAFMVGLGAGYQVNRWFRTDVTIDIRTPSDFAGSYVCGCTGNTRETAKIGVSTAMWNGYLEMGKWSRITPYLGAGIGMAHLHVHDYRGYNPPSYALAVRHKGHGSLNVAWALMAGASYDISKNAKFDVGYRYLNLGDARTKYDSIGNAIKFKDLAAHEVRMGLRYLID